MNRAFPKCVAIVAVLMLAATGAFAQTLTTPTLQVTDLGYDWDSATFTTETAGQSSIEWNVSSAMGDPSPDSFYLAVFDLYDSDFEYNVETNDIWFNYSSSVVETTMDLNTGGYWAVIYAAYDEDTTPTWVGSDPVAWMQVSGEPHAPYMNATASSTETITVEFQPDLYGTWTYWYVVFDVAAGDFIEVDGLLWNWIEWGQDEFVNGTFDISLPATEEGYVVFMLGLGWDATTWGASNSAFVVVE